MPGSTIGEIVDLQVPDGTMRVFTARGEVGGVGAGDWQYPAIIVIQEAFGTSMQIQRWSRRLAAEGYFTAAPVLYHRNGVNPTTAYDAQEEFMKLRLGVSNAAITQDLNALMDYFRRAPNVDESRVGIVGFCMGGTVSFLAAARVPGIKAAAVYYGNRIIVPDGEGGATLLDEAANIKGPLIGFYGALDPNMTAEQLEMVKGKLKEAEVDADIHFYEGADHGFMRDDDPDVFNETVSNDAWEKTLAFFQKHLQQ